MQILVPPHVWLVPPHFVALPRRALPRACILCYSCLGRAFLCSPEPCCSLIWMFLDEDIVAVRVDNVRQKRDSFVFVSAYMAAEEPAPPNSLKNQLIFTENEQIPTIVGTDANVHHTIWGPTT